jgi:hypothetical protein
MCVYYGFIHVDPPRDEKNEMHLAFFGGSKANTLALFIEFLKRSTAPKRQELYCTKISLERNDEFKPLKNNISFRGE